MKCSTGIVDQLPYPLPVHAIYTEVIINHSRDITGVGVAHDIKITRKAALIFPDDNKAVSVS